MKTFEALMLFAMIFIFMVTALALAPIPGRRVGVNWATHEIIPR